MIETSRSVVPVNAEFRMVNDYTQPSNPAQDAIRRLQAALFAYHATNVPDLSNPDGIVEVAIRRLSELYLVATKAP